MSQRAAELASRFDSVVDQVVGAVADCPDETWFSTGPDGGWTVAFETYHIAMGMDFEHRWISALTGGGSIEPLSMAAIDAMNEREAVEHATIDRSTALSELDANRRLVHDHIASLTDNQLELTYPQDEIFAGAPADRTVSIDRIIVRIYIGHVEGHLRNIQEKLAVASSRVEQLKQMFDDYADRLEKIATVASAGDWETICPEEGWTVGFEVYHVAVWLELEIGWISRVADRRPLIPSTREAVDAFNDRHAAEHMDVSTDEALRTLNENRLIVDAFLASLTDERLDQVTTIGYFFIGDDTARETRTLEQIIRRAFLGHVESHLRSMQKVLGEAWFVRNGIRIVTEVV